jgi:hypothetical protein
MINPINESSITKDENIFENVQFLNEEMFFRYKKKKNVPKEFQDEAVKLVELFEKELGTKVAGGTDFTSRWHLGEAKERIKKKIRKQYSFSMDWVDMDKKTGNYKMVLSNMFKTVTSIRTFFNQVMKKSGFKLVDPSYSDIGWVKEFDDYMIGVTFSVNGNENINQTTVVYIHCLEIEGKKGEKNKRTMAGKLVKF